MNLLVKSSWHYINILCNRPLISLLSTIEVLSHEIASTDLYTMSPDLESGLSLYRGNIVTLLVHSLHPRIKMGTWHMRRAGYVNKKALASLFGSSACMLHRDLRMLWIVQVSPGGNMYKSCEAIYFTSKTIRLFYNAFVHFLASFVYSFLKWPWLTKNNWYHVSWYWHLFVTICKTEIAP